MARGVMQSPATITVPTSSASKAPRLDGIQAHAFTYRGIVAETSRGPLNYPAINQQAAQMDDFADCILTGRNTPAPGELGRCDMQIITAVYEAARTGKKVRVRA